MKIRMFDSVDTFEREKDEQTFDGGGDSDENATVKQMFRPRVQTKIFFLRRFYDNSVCLNDELFLLMSPFGSRQLDERADQLIESVN